MTDRAILVASTPSAAVELRALDTDAKVAVPRCTDIVGETRAAVTTLRLTAKPSASQTELVAVAPDTGVHDRAFRAEASHAQSRCASTGRQTSTASATLWDAAVADCIYALRTELTAGAPFERVDGRTLGTEPSYAVSRRAGVVGETGTSRATLRLAAIASSSKAELVAGAPFA